jgi:hypothetical protein
MMVNTASNIGIGEEVSPMKLNLVTWDKDDDSFDPNYSPAIQGGSLNTNRL